MTLLLRDRPGRKQKRRWQAGFDVLESVDLLSPFAVLPVATVQVTQGGNATALAKEIATHADSGPLVSSVVYQQPGTAIRIGAATVKATDGTMISLVGNKVDNKPVVVDTLNAELNAGPAKIINGPSNTAGLLVIKDGLVSFQVTAMTVARGQNTTHLIVSGKGTVEVKGKDGCNNVQMVTGNFVIDTTFPECAPSPKPVTPPPCPPPAPKPTPPPPAPAPKPVAISVLATCKKWVTIIVQPGQPYPSWPISLLQSNHPRWGLIALSQAGYGWW